MVEADSQEDITVSNTVLSQLFRGQSSLMCVLLGAVNINFTGMTKRRFMAGKMALTDLVTTEEGREKFKVRACTCMCMYMLDSRRQALYFDIPLTFSCIYIQPRATPRTTLIGRL